MKKIYFFLLAAVACSLQMNATEGALQGRFTINQNGDQVVFSQGNLQYQASTQTWRFAENQYDYVGDATNGNVYVGETKSDNSLISDTYDGWIDLFGWGTGDAPTKHSTNNDDYATFTEWGTNAISNGGVDTWRTPTKDDWDYLFYTRENAATLFALAKVNDISGLIILPDNWNTPDGLTFTPSATKGMENQGGYYVDDEDDEANHFKDNIYNLEQWQVMQDNGAVFLPCGGYRNGTSMNVNSNSQSGYYWTHTQQSSDEAYRLFFDYGTIMPKDYYSRYLGLSVRLVKDIDTTPIENVQSDNVQSTKVLRNGLLLIERNGKTYNALGAEMK